MGHIYFLDCEKGMMVFSFIFCLLMFVVIGVLSVVKSRSTTQDYLIAGQSVKPWLVALSAVATNNSGYMFVGMIGFTFTWGLSSIWLMIGWIVGDFLSSLFIHKRLREATTQTNQFSYAGVLSRWHGVDFPWVRVLGGIVTVIFLGTYAAAQLKAGSKALTVLFGWDYSVGAIIGAVIVVVYCLAGGIRASIWTDAAQSIVMIVAMFLLLIGGIYESGGLHATYQQLNGVSPDYLALFAQQSRWAGPVGPALFILGWLFAGFGVVGQPHIMVRFMAMDNPKSMVRARIYYYSWYSAFFALTICVGLLSRILMPEVGLFDSELALPLLAQQLFPAVLIGLVLAALFAATMSTADSQILSCTASITCDFPILWLKNYWVTKATTFFITLLALIIALSAKANVFYLVVLAWSALASTFVPLIVTNALGGRPRQITAVAMMLTGLITMTIWYQLGLSDAVLEVMPGVLCGFLPYLIQVVVSRGVTVEKRKFSQPAAKID